MKRQELPLPPHFDPARVGEVFRVAYQERAAEARRWAEEHALRPAAADDFRLCLLLVDAQNTFCTPGFELFVAGRSGHGAVEDNRRLCEFIYRNLGSLTQIHATLDTHTALQIFHPLFLLGARGEHPAPLTAVSLEDVEKGVWRANPAVAPSLGLSPEALQQHLLHYCRELSRGGKYSLMVWPFHAMLGGIGHALASSVEEALFFHTVARLQQTAFEVKGGNPLTENYSVLRAEVLEGADGRPIAESNQRLIRRLLEFDAVIVAGEAKSHCVAWTVEDLLTEIRAVDPRRTSRIYLLDDCSSPVVAPGVVDFTDQADAAYARFAAAGMNRVRSTEPLDAWPGPVGEAARALARS
jgi:nicotinamidase-related amidase